MSSYLKITDFFPTCLLMLLHFTHICDSKPVTSDNNESLSSSTLKIPRGRVGTMHYHRPHKIPKMTSTPVVIPAQTNHTMTVIFLHGLGGNGHGWANVFPELRQPYMKIICPTANNIPISISNGTKMRGWYDKYANESTEDPKGVGESTAYVQDLFEKEIANGIPPERIVVGGFSQGGAIALNAGLTYTKKLGGIIGLAAYIPLINDFSEDLISANKDTPVLQWHGEDDPCVPIGRGQKTANILKKALKNYQFISEPCEKHRVSKRGFADIKQFLETKVPQT